MISRKYEGLQILTQSWIIPKGMGFTQMMASEADQEKQKEFQKFK